jgi:hypothetical protein
MKSNPLPYAEVDPATNTNPGELNRRMARLAEERSALFDKAGSNSGLSDGDRQRLGSIERELDECFLARRRHRAKHDAHRFDTDLPIARRPAQRGT